MCELETVTIWYVRNGDVRHYSFTGTTLERDREIWLMLRTDGVTSAWYN